MLSKILILVSFVLIISSCDNGNTPTNHESNSQLSSKIDIIGDSLTSSIIVNGRNESVPGAIIGVISIDNNFSYLKSFGNANIISKTPLFRSDRFRIGALTQSFIATLTLRMIDENKIELDDIVNKYVALPHSGSLITIRHLLNMSSGIADFTDSVKYYQDIDPLLKWTNSQLLKFAFDASFSMKPGKERKFSNTNYLILGMILEKVSGESLSELIENRILNVLKLENTDFDSKGSLSNKPYSHGYLLTDRNGFFDVTNYYDYSWSWGSSNMTSDANDLLYWIESLSKGSLVSSNSSELMQKFEITNDFGNKSIYYGMGLMRLGSFVGFSSDFDGYNLSVYNLPSKNLSILVFTNASNSNDDVLIKIANLIIPGIKF